MNQLSEIDYYASLPRKRTAVGLLIMRDKKMLIVEPSYRKDWLVVGGVVEKDELFINAAQRECLEEISCGVEIKKLLCIEHKNGSATSGDSIHLIFLGDIGTQEIKIDNDEIKSYLWLQPKEALPKLAASLSLRMEAALQALRDEKTYYCENGKIIF